MGIAQMDWEKVVIASTRIKKAEYLPKVERKQGVGCVIDDLSALQAGDEDDEMMELWWGDEAREGKEIRTYVHDLDDTEMMIGAKVAYDMVSSPVVPAEGWKQAPENALEFTVLLCKGEIKRPALILKGEAGIYDRVQIYESKATERFLVELKAGEMKSGIVDDAVKNGRTKKPAVPGNFLHLLRMEPG